MTIKIYVNVTWEKSGNMPEHLERVSVTVRDWDRGVDDSLVREHSANGSLANLKTERDVYLYVNETLEMFEQEGIKVPETIHYTVERTNYQDFKPADFDIF